MKHTVDTLRMKLYTLMINVNNAQYVMVQF